MQNHKTQKITDRHQPKPGYFDRPRMIEKLNRMRNDYLKSLDGAGATAIGRVIDRLERADEHLIRCADCYHCLKKTDPNGFIYAYCQRDGNYFPVELDDYCSWAEEDD